MSPGGALTLTAGTASVWATTTGDLEIQTVAAADVILDADDGVDTGIVRIFGETNTTSDILRFGTDTDTVSLSKTAATTLTLGATEMATNAASFSIDVQDDGTLFTIGNDGTINTASVDDTSVVGDALTGAALNDALTADSITAETAGDLTLAGNAGAIILNDNAITVGTTGADTIDVCTLGGTCAYTLGGAAADTVNIATDADTTVDTITIGNADATDVINLDGNVVIDGTTGTLTLGATGSPVAFMRFIEAATVSFTAGAATVTDAEVSAASVIFITVEVDAATNGIGGQLIVVPR